MTTLTLNLDHVRQAARRCIAERTEPNDVAIVRTIASQIDPEIVKLDGRELGVRALKLLAPRLPADDAPAPKQCACHAPKIDHMARAEARLVAVRDRIESERARRDRRDADRAERERVEREREELRRVQDQLDRAFSIRLAERDRLAVERNNALLDARNDEVIAGTRAWLEQTAAIRWANRGPL